MSICMMKIGMTEIPVNESIEAATLLFASNNKVLGVKTLERDGYMSMIMGYGQGKAKSWNKAQHYLFSKLSNSNTLNTNNSSEEVSTNSEEDNTFDKSNSSKEGSETNSENSCNKENCSLHSKFVPQKIYEHRVFNSKELLEIGSEFPIVDYFSAGSYVDVSGKTKGRGFSGVMKRHNFHGMPASHGVSKAHRKQGSTGNRTDPGRVFKGKKMAGHYGNENQTIQNLKILKTELIDYNGIKGSLLFVGGAVPGPVSGLCFVKQAVKRCAK